MTIEELDKLNYLWLELDIKGINFDPEIFKDIDFENLYLGRKISYKNKNGEVIKSIVPSLIRFPNGYPAQYEWKKSSEYSIIKENDKFYLHKNDERIFEVTPQLKPKFLNKYTSDGIKFEDFIGYNRGKKISTVFSDECSLFEKGAGCFFCGINGKNKLLCDENKKKESFIKTARQIAEGVKEAYSEGYNHFVVTGGFIPERRELEYYVDIAESIREIAGIDDFNGTPVIGAPLDLNMIDKYKEAGYRTIATNIEIWDRNIWKAVCPGKDKYCGGRDNWENCLKHEVEVFGKGNVRSCIVAGIETKDTILEGVEYLASLGIITQVQPWKPRENSNFAGHQSPTTSWHLDLMKKVYGIFKRYGFTHKQVYDALSHAETIYDHYYDFDGDVIEDEKFKIDDN